MLNKPPVSNEPEVSPTRSTTGRADMTGGPMVVAVLTINAVSGVLPS
ncbi:hypothetical protein [Corynebacterium halotolerans]